MKEFEFPASYWKTKFVNNLLVFDEVKSVGHKAQERILKGEKFSNSFQYLKVIDGVNLAQHLNLPRFLVVHIRSIVHIQLENYSSKLIFS